MIHCVCDTYLPDSEVPLRGPSEPGLEMGVHTAGVTLTVHVIQQVTERSIGSRHVVMDRFFYVRPMGIKP